MSDFKSFVQNKSNLTSYDSIIAKTKKMWGRLENEGFRIGVNSRLDNYNRVLEIFRAVVYRQKSVHELDLKLLHQALFEITNFNFIFDVFLKPPEISNWRQKFQSVLSGKDFPEDELAQSRARDTQFELLIAAVCRKSGFKISLDEPDVLVEFDDSKMGIAAKRLKSIKKIRRHLRKATKQITATKQDGIICIDLTSIQNPRNQLIRVVGERDINLMLQHIASQFLQRNWTNICGLVDDESVLGVMAYMSGLFLVGNQPQLGTAAAWSVSNRCKKSDSRYDLLYNFTKKLGEGLIE